MKLSNKDRKTILQLWEENKHRPKEDIINIQSGTEKQPVLIGYLKYLAEAIEKKVI